MTKLSALVVEDDAPLQLIYKRMLQNCGYDVHVVQDGDSALAYLEHAVPQLIFLDILLPMVNGEVVVNYLEDKEHFQNTHVVIVSSNKEFERLAQMLPSAQFLLKPIMPVQIQQIAEACKSP